MSKTETEKLAGTVNGCLQFVILALIVLVGGCIFGPCAVPFILSGAQ
jgi:hypothetical protein